MKEFKILTVCFVVIFCIFILLLFGCKECKGPYESKFGNQEYIEKIASIKNSYTTSGGFFLGCGTVGEKSYYYYYKIAGNNSYLLEKVPVDNTLIIEDCPINKVPFVSYTATYDKGTLKILSSKHNIKFHVPKGTVVKEFRLQ